MNVSMHDSFNLGWKLAAVIRGHSAPEILNSYSSERRAIAAELVNFDRQLATMFSAPEDTSPISENEGPQSTELQKYMVMHDGYVSGTMTHYGPSRVIAEPSNQALASGFEIGKRFHSTPVVRLADGRPIHLGHVLEADGRWRIIVFSNAEDPTSPSSAIRQLAELLQNSAESPVNKYTPADTDIDAVIEVLAVFQQGCREINIEAIPAFLAPPKGVYGLRDYEKTFCPDLDKGLDIFDERGIDRSTGCIVVVRPDQHVANILPLGGFRELAAFFDGFMIAQD